MYVGQRTQCGAYLPVLCNALQIAEGATVILTASTQASADKAVAHLREKYPQATVAGIIDWPYEVEQ